MPEQDTTENNLIDYVELNVADIERAKIFYGSVFGWSFTDYGETYCEFNDGRMKGGFSSQEPANPGGPLIVLYHSDLKTVQAKILEAGGKITMDIFSFPGGERFQFLDLDGYELAVWRKK